MAATGRRGPPHLATELVDEGWRFNFFQAVRLLQLMEPDSTPVGTGDDPEAESVRFSSRVSLSFPPGDLHARAGARFLPLRDSMQCFTLSIENPPADVGEYRVFNQFEEVYGINELAEKVQKVGNSQGLNVEIKNLENPRKEMEEHYFNPDHQHLLDLGYQPTHDMERELEIMMADLTKYRDRIEARKEALIPDIRWDGSRKKVSFKNG